MVDDQERLKLVDDVARALADAALDVDATLAAFAEAVVPALADDCVVFVIEDDGTIRRVAEASVSAEHRETLRELRAHPPAVQASNTVASTVRGGKTVFVPRVDDRTIDNLAGNVAHGASLRSLSPTTFVTVPLVARGHTVGAFTFGMSVSPRTYEPEDLTLAEELGRRAGVAVDNARLFRDAVHARARAEHAEQRMMRLQEVTESLARVMSPVEAGAAILAQAAIALGARGGGVYRRRGDELEVLAVTTVASNVAVTSRHVFEPERVVLALTVKGQPIGMLVLVYDPPRGFSSEDRRFADAIAWQCALALERSSLVQRERESAERAGLLVEASELFARSREPEGVFEELARRIVPRFADWCSFELVEPGRLRQAGKAHVDPVKLQWVEALRRKVPVDTTPSHGVYAVIGTKRSELHAHVTPEILDGMAVDREHRELLGRLAIGSALVVPMVASGVALGGMKLVWGEASGRRFDRDDLELFEELAHRDLKQAVQVRDDFLAAAGHELKTPLAALLMHVESLERLVKRDVIPANLALRLDKASRTGLRLATLVDELLDVSRITAGRLELVPERVQLDELVREVVERFADQAISAECPIALAAESVSGNWDRSRLDQVVSNLIANALKYGRGRPVEIFVGTDEDRVLVRVVDHGIGIAPGEQVKIFDRFERAVQSRSFAGFGLGLWIARQIVEASGGTIDVASLPGEGATFSVLLPR